MLIHRESPQGQSCSLKGFLDPLRKKRESINNYYWYNRGEITTVLVVPLTPSFVRRTPLRFSMIDLVTLRFFFFFLNSQRIQTIHPQREKVHGVKSGGNQVQAFKNLLSVKSHKTCLISPQWLMTMYVKHVISSLETQCPGILRVVSHAASV